MPVFYIIYNTVTIRILGFELVKENNLIIQGVPLIWQILRHLITRKIVCITFISSNSKPISYERFIISMISILFP